MDLLLQPVPLRMQSDSDSGLFPSDSVVPVLSTSRNKRKNFKPRSILNSYTHSDTPDPDGQENDTKKEKVECHSPSPSIPPPIGLNFIFDRPQSDEDPEDLDDSNDELDTRPFPHPVKTSVDNNPGAIGRSVSPTSSCSSPSSNYSFSSSSGVSHKLGSSKSKSGHQMSSTPLVEPNRHFGPLDLSHSPSISPSESPSLPSLVPSDLPSFGVKRQKLEQSESPPPSQRHSTLSSSPSSNGFNGRKRKDSPFHPSVQSPSPPLPPPSHSTSRRSRLALEGDLDQDDAPPHYDHLVYHVSKSNGSSTSSWKPTGSNLPSIAPWIDPSFFNHSSCGGLSARFSELQKGGQSTPVDYTRYVKRYGSSAECGSPPCTQFHYREHFHCLDCNSRVFVKKEEMIRHFKWHKKRDESLQHGFMRYSPCDDCSIQFAQCPHNQKQTHYHCLKKGCFKTYISTSDVQMHANYHRKDTAIIQEGFQRFRANEDCATDTCPFQPHKTTHFHCRRDNCNFTFKNKADMEKHKSFHMKEEQMTRDGFKKFSKNESCNFDDCRFSSVCNHIHCIRPGCNHVFHSSGQLYSHKRKHEKSESDPDLSPSESNQSLTSEKGSFPASSMSMTSGFGQNDSLMRLGKSGSVTNSSPMASGSGMGSSGPNFGPITQVYPTGTTLTSIDGLPVFKRKRGRPPKNQSVNQTIPPPPPPQSHHTSVIPPSAAPSMMSMSSGGRNKESRDISSGVKGRDRDHDRGSDRSIEPEQNRMMHWMQSQMGNKDPMKNPMDPMSMMNSMGPSGFPGFPSLSSMSPMGLAAAASGAGSGLTPSLMQALQSVMTNSGHGTGGSSSDSGPYIPVPILPILQLFNLPSNGSNGHPLLQQLGLNHLSQLEQFKQFTQGSLPFLGGGGVKPPPISPIEGGSLNGFPFDALHASVIPHPLAMNMGPSHSNGSNGIINPRLPSPNKATPLGHSECSTSSRTPSPSHSPSGLSPLAQGASSSSGAGTSSLKDEPVPDGYIRFRFNQDCGYSNCGYREHQTHFHCMRSACGYSFCDKTRFLQHTSRHERLDTLMGKEFMQFRSNVPCGYPECPHVSLTGSANTPNATSNSNSSSSSSSSANKSSHFHCLKCPFVCTDTNRVVAHRRQHLKMDSINAAGFDKYTPSQNCAVDGCPYNHRQTHYHCLKCGYSVLGLSQMSSHKYKHLNQGGSPLLPGSPPLPPPAPPSSI